ncbi:hypothetical protein [Brevundimonas nasdae]|uniref:hypothetical protein n=1 Tax=Brevundimonas nasdae TaxID=172043 RepID=UPI003018A947
MTNDEIRWFVLPPTQNFETWRSVLRSHAQAQGLSVVEVVAGNEQITLDDIVLTADLDFARLVGASAANTTVLDLPPFVDLTDCAPADIPFRVLDATRKIAAAHDFEGRFTSVDASLPVPFADLPALEAGSRSPSALEIHLQNALAFLNQGSAEWSPEIFSYAKGVGGPDEAGVLDITGRPRLAIHGPYIFLTRGVWRVTVRLSFDADAAQKPYQIQWGGSESYAEHDFSPGRSGIYEITLEHEWPTHAATEVRLLLLQGAFHGQITLHGAVVQRVS